MARAGAGPAARRRTGSPARIVRGFATAGRHGLDALLAVVLAPSCAVCRTPLDAPTRGPVCPACWRTVPRITPPVCDGCGDPLPVEPAGATTHARGEAEAIPDARTPETAGATTAPRGMGPPPRTPAEIRHEPAGATTIPRSGVSRQPAAGELRHEPAGATTAPHDRHGATTAPRDRRGGRAAAAALLAPRAAPPRCPRCRRPNALIPRRRAVGPYEGALRQLVHVLKYEQRQTLAAPLGRLMRRSGAAVLADADCVAAVPLHARRQWARGFNQAAALAAGLGPPVVDALRRTRPTPPQTTLPAGQRRRNVRGAFAPARRLGGRAAVEGACVVLVDDVTTTGATLDACARVLRRAGAREVRALTLARVVHRARP